MWRWRPLALTWQLPYFRVRLAEADYARRTAVWVCIIAFAVLYSRYSYFTMTRYAACTAMLSFSDVEFN